MRPCSIDGCPNPSRTKRLCKMHYARLLRHGDPLRTRPSAADVFWANVDKNGPLPAPDTLAVGLGSCWLWTGGQYASGYGRISVTQKNVRAHRFSFALHGGTLVEGLTIDHLCRVRHCVNPDHLEQVTAGVNNLRSNCVSGINSRKTHCHQGHPFDQSNTYRPPRGDRVCRVCKKSGRRAA